jgi:hypothetical protein
MEPFTNVALPEKYRLPIAPKVPTDNQVSILRNSSSAENFSDKFLTSNYGKIVSRSNKYIRIFMSIMDYGAS